MSSRAARMQATATRLLTKFDERTGDERMTITRTAPPTWDGVTAETVPGAVTTIPLTGITKKINQSLVNGTTIQTGDIMLTMTSATAPQVDDKINIDGVRYSVIDIPIARYTNTTILYSVQLRK